jgi:transposase
VAAASVETGKGDQLAGRTQRDRTSAQLIPVQERQVLRWINGQNLMQYEFDFELWTRQIVRELVAIKFAVRLSLASVSALLAHLGLTAQKPLQRQTCHTLAAQAKRDGAVIKFWDESGFRTDSCSARPGHLVVNVLGQRQGISAASAVSAKGAFWFATYHGALNGESFVDLLKKLMHRRKKPLPLVLDGLPAHKTKAVKTYVASTHGRLTSHVLPGCAPELNPNELMWSHAKRTGHARRPANRRKTGAARGRN